MKHFDAKYIYAHQVLNIAYPHPLDNIEYLFLYDTRTVIAPGDASIIKEEIFSMVNSLATDTDNIIRITNLLNKFHMYTIYNEGDIQTLSND